MYIDFNKDNNMEGPKSKVSDNVRISKYKNIFAKGYFANWCEEFFKNTVPWTYFINNLNGEEIVGTFYEKELQKTNQKGFRVEKVVKKKGNKLYDLWKGYDSFFIRMFDTTKDMI